VKNLILPEQPVTPMIYHKGKLGALPPWAESAHALQRAAETCATLT
jgi:hypothetical protein